MTLNSQASSRVAAEERRLERQVELDAERTAKERNEWGQFATPPGLARDVVAYALGLHGERSIDFLEPSCGSGAFFSALLEELPDGREIRTAVGVELDPRFADLAQELWGALGLRVLNADYTAPDVVARGSASLLVANPPYVRHHHLTSEQKSELSARATRELGITPSGLSGLYAHFMFLSHRNLAPGAVSAWLIPSEFLDVNYGTALKQYLTTHVTLNRIHRFDPDDVQFDDALVTSSVVVFTNEMPTDTTLVEFTHGGSMEDPRETHIVPLNGLQPVAKWSPRFSGGSQDESRDMPRFDEFFRIRRGIATGNNAFFILPRERAEGLGIKREHLKPMLPGPRYLKQDVVEGDDAGYPVLDKQLALIDTLKTIDHIEEDDPALAAYLSSVDEKTKSGFLVRSRSPWYKQEQREAAPFVITYMGRGAAMAERPFRFIMNQSAAITTNMYLMLYPIASLEAALSRGDVELPQVHEAVNALSGQQLRDGGRVYGGGLHKMEPKELAALDASTIAALLPNYQRPEQVLSLF